MQAVFIDCGLTPDLLMWCPTKSISTWNKQHFLGFSISCSSQIGWVRRILECVGGFPAPSIVWLCLLQIHSQEVLVSYVVVQSSTNRHVQILSCKYTVSQKKVAHCTLVHIFAKY